MKPLWVVDITISDAIVVAASDVREAEKIALEEFECGNCDVDTSCPILSTSSLPMNNGTWRRWYGSYLPYGIDEPLTANEYMEKYEEWKKEVDKKIELEAKQGKLF